MSNPSRSPSTIQPRNASSPLRKSTDRAYPSPKFSSPSDSSNKNFRSRQFSLEKENEQDPVAASTTKGRSTLMSSSPKKNFMAPTISASSKAVGPFQRKRVLGERNETVKTSSFPVEEISGHTVNFQLASTQVEETGNCSCKSFISSSQGELPPYDPKVNYLSPRPRFLHYKPKPQGVPIVNELDFFGADSDSTSPDNSSSSEGSDGAISVQTEDENNLLKEPIVPQVETPEIKLQHSRVASMRVQLKLRHVLLVLLIGCICIPLSDSPMIASHSNPNVPLVRVVGFHARLLEVSSKLNGWLSKCFLYSYASDRSFPRKIDTFPLANLTCLMDDNGNVNNMEGEEKETLVSFDMVIRENERSEEQIRFDIGKLEEEVEEGEEGVEEEEEGKEIEEDAGHASEMVTSTFISEMKEEETQLDMFEKSDLEKLVISESELVENKEVNDLEVIISENPEPKLKEPESVNMSDEQINISRKAIQTVVPIAVLLSLVAAIVAKIFAKKKQNRVLVSDSVCGGTLELAQDSSESHVQNENSLDREFSSSSFEVGTYGGYTITPRERQARRESDASSGSYGSYVSFEKISSKKGHGEVEEMITPVRRSSRLRDRTTSSYRTISS